MTFDSRMPKIEDGSGIIVVVRMCVVLELVGALVYGHDGFHSSPLEPRFVHQEIG
jgi:hypothetical protein